MTKKEYRVGHRLGQSCKIGTMGHSGSALHAMPGLDRSLSQSMTNDGTVVWNTKQ